MFRIVVEPHLMERSAFGSIVGQMWLQFDATVFPNAGYSDMVVAVLAHWATESIQLKGGKQRARCYFMDDPYHLNISRVGRNWRIRVMRRRVGPSRCLVETVQPSKGVTQAIIKAGKQVLKECDRRGWTNRDVQCLREALKTLATLRSQPGRTSK